MMSSPCYLLTDVQVEFRQVGLDIGMEKTHWTSWPPRTGDDIDMDGVIISWEPHLVYVGGTLHLKGNSSGAIDFWMIQAEDVL